MAIQYNIQKFCLTDIEKAGWDKLPKIPHGAWRINKQPRTKKNKTVD